MNKIVLSEEGQKAKKWFSNWMNGENIHKKHYQLVEEINSYNPTSIFEFGCGNGKILDLYDNIYGDSKLHGCDMSVPAIELGKERGRDYITIGDENYLLNLKDNQYDVVYTCSVLDHIPMPECDIIIQHLLRIGKNVIFSEATEHHEWQEAMDYWYFHDYDSYGVEEKLGPWDGFGDGTIYHLYKMKKNIESKIQTSSHEEDLKISIDAIALGDILNVTPVIRKLSDVAKKLNKSLSVYVNKPDILKNNPYCNVFQKDLFEKTDNSFEIIVRSDNRFMIMGSNQVSQLNYGGNNLVDYLSMQCGFSLAPNEKTLDYFPDDSDIFTRYDIPDNYVVFNPSITWESRTWSKNNWTKLIDLCNDSGIFVILVGRGIENATKEDVKNLEVGIIGGLNISNGLDLQNKTSLDDLWHLLDKAKYLVCTDSGILHFAGTSDVEILMVPGSINPYHRLPFRNGSQDYKTKVVYGDCKIFCASNIAYNKIVHGTFLGTPPINSCLENYQNFDCHSKVDDIFSEIKVDGSIINKINTDCNITYRFGNYHTDINNSEIVDTNKIWLNFWDAVGDVSVNFIDASEKIPISRFQVSVKSEGEFWFETHSVFSEYDNFKIEVVKDETVIYRKLF